MAYKELPLPSPIELPEGYFMARKPGFAGEGIEYSIRRLEPTGNISDSWEVGRIVANPSELSEDLIVMSSDLNPELQRKGIARSIYKQAEKDLGKKIIPDQILSDMSSPLHKKYGLGKEFGMPSYEETIRKGMEKKAVLDNISYAGKPTTQFDPISGQSFETTAAPLFPPEFAKKEYQRIKKIMNEVHGLDKFKSIAPYLLKGAGLAGALMAPSADAAAADAVIPGGVEGLGQNDSEVLRDRKYRSANLIPNTGMLGDYTDAPDTGRYQQKMRQLSNRGM